MRTGPLHGDTVGGGSECIRVEGATGRPVKRPLQRPDIESASFRPCSGQVGALSERLLSQPVRKGIYSTVQVINGRRMRDMNFKLYRYRTYVGVSIYNTVTYSSGLFLFFKSVEMRAIRPAATFTASRCSPSTTLPRTSTSNLSECHRSISD